MELTAAGQFWNHTKFPFSFQSLKEKETKYGTNLDKFPLYAI